MRNGSELANTFQPLPAHHLQMSRFDVRLIWLDGQLRCLWRAIPCKTAADSPSPRGDEKGTFKGVMTSSICLLLRSSASSSSLRNLWK